VGRKYLQEKKGKKEAHETEKRKTKVAMEEYDHTAPRSSGKINPS
jgi:hypothetical protein